MSTPIDPQKPLTVGLLLVRLGVDIAEGKIVDAVDAARQIFDLGVGLIPVEGQKQFLTEYDRTFVDLTVDAEETIKLDAQKL